MKKETKDLNLYYMDNGQVENDEKIEKQNKRKIAKKRQKRIKQNIKNKEKNEFDIEDETVIEMTNRNRLKKDEEQRKKITKKEKKRRKKIKRIKFVLKIFLLLCVIAGIIVFAFTSPIFNIKDIKVINNSQITSENIISLSGIKTGENLFKFSSIKAQNGIKENPYIESVKVNRKFPNTIEIDVKERTATYSVDFLGKYAYINNQGYILEISEDSKNMPIILSVSTPEEQINAGNRLNEEDLEKLEDVLKITAVMTENNLNDKVTSIDIKDKNEYIIYLEEEQKTVHIGDSTNLNNKILYVLAILEAEKGKKGDIYVNGDLNNKFQPYFRESVTV